MVELVSGQACTVAAVHTVPVDARLECHLWIRFEGYPRRQGQEVGAVEFPELDTALAGYLFPLIGKNKHVPLIKRIGTGGEVDTADTAGAAQGIECPAVGASNPYSAFQCEE